MLKLITKLKPYSPYILVALVVLILSVSSTPDIPTLKIHAGKKTLRLDYLIHFCEYGALSVIAFLTFSGRQFSAGLIRFSAVTSGLILFAVADEFHQKIIPGRTFSPYDVTSNLLGVFAALLFCIFIFRIIRSQISNGRV
ncbi:MAG TPA: VanZ family protein [Bacteroidales bacterium]|nr:VanZ family protein [Bacteroidales bacterium]